MKKILLHLFATSIVTLTAFSQETPKIFDSSRIGGTVTVYVTGEVIAPKTLSIPKNVGLVAVIYASGGPKDFANMKKITVIRAGKVTVLDRTRHPKDIFELKNEDIVYLPQIKELFGK